MIDKFFAYSNKDDIRDEYFYLEDYVLYEDDCIVMGGNKLNFAQNNDYAVLIMGHIYNIHEFTETAKKVTDAEVILSMINDVVFGELCRQFSGNFCIMLYDKTDKAWDLATDIFGQFCPYYYLDDEEFIISTDFYDFHKDFFDIDSTAFFKSMAFYDDPRQSVLGGVKRTSKGTILLWPECEQEIYIDLYEELEEAYMNKLDISFDDAVTGIFEILKSSVENITRWKDKSKIGMIASNGMGDAAALAVLNKCKIEPYLYVPYFPVVENELGITQEKALDETKKRLYDFDDMLKYVKYTDVCKIAYNEDMIDEYFTEELEQPIMHTAMESSLCFNIGITNKMQEDEIECLLTTDGVNVIFLHWILHYISYKVENDPAYERIDLYNSTFDDIEKCFSEEIHNTELYSFGAFTEKNFNNGIKRGGLIDRISGEELFNEKTNKTQHDYISYNAVRNNLYKNHTLWKFVLSLPPEIMADSMLNATLLNGVFKKATRRKKDVIKFKKRDFWGIYPRKYLFYEDTGEFIDMKSNIRYTETLANLLIDAIVFFQRLGVHVHQLWEIEDKQDLNTEIMLPGSLKLILMYKHLKPWVKGYHYVPKSINNK